MARKKHMKKFHATSRIGRSSMGLVRTNEHLCAGKFDGSEGGSTRLPASSRGNRYGPKKELKRDKAPAGSGRGTKSPRDHHGTN